jgi:hypothetical protein
MCVGAIANGWKLSDTSTFCDECREHALFWVYRAAGWLFNFFPPPVPILLAMLLAAGASLATHKVYKSYEPIQEIVVTEEQTL